MDTIFHQPIGNIIGIAPAKLNLLKQELAISYWGELLSYYPFRYEDKTKIYQLNEYLIEGNSYQFVGYFSRLPQPVGAGKARRFAASFSDGNGYIELVWFNEKQFKYRNYELGKQYLVYGKISKYGRSSSIVSPEIEVFSAELLEKNAYLQPIYTIPEKLKRKYIDSKFISQVLQAFFKAHYSEIEENLTDDLIQEFGLLSRKKAILAIHFPVNEQQLTEARNRLKFEEIFFLQLKMLQSNFLNKKKLVGFKFSSAKLVAEFYNHNLPFPLTNAQKRVLREIYEDCTSGSQMNRLLQGDVGSGKTMVAFISCLMAVSNGFQACLMAPTEILAEQHLKSLEPYAKACGLTIAKLTGSVKKKDRDTILNYLKAGDLHIIVGTHALLTETVLFKNLGLCIIDEQHRFGVAQRAALWEKSKENPPHILVMTATPIPRTLAMTLYGELDVSVIDELPPGRKPITTYHFLENKRLRMFGMIKEEIAKGRQVYVVYPLIEESEKLDFAHLYEGYDSICDVFPQPQYQVCVVHGKMKQEDREAEMQRFAKGKAHIMVATTVIEVGVNVPNASVMVIESAERFGLSQLHQLRGRVGRGADQSFCILMTGEKLSSNTRIRMQTMVETNDGFKISEVDMKLRGPGDITGTQQSGVVDLALVNLATDADLVQAARNAASHILSSDTELALVENQVLRRYLFAGTPKHRSEWSMIS